MREERRQQDQKPFNKLVNKELGFEKVSIWKNKIGQENMKKEITGGRSHTGRIRGLDPSQVFADKKADNNTN